MKTLLRAFFVFIDFSGRVGVVKFSSFSPLKESFYSLLWGQPSLRGVKMKTLVADKPALRMCMFKNSLKSTCCAKIGSLMICC
jgi:hypothetical protein